MGLLIRRRNRVIWACLLAAACGDPTDPADLIPASIEITPAAAILAAIGEEVQLTATVRNRKGEVLAGETLVWASADATVASVGGTGLLTAVHNGNTLISAASENGVVGKAAVAVAQLASDIRLSLSADSLRAIEDTLWIAATVVDSRGNRIADPDVIWSSSFVAVATVDADGVVLAVGNGRTEITAVSGPATASAPVTVDQRVAEIRLSGGGEPLAALDDTVRLVAEVVDENGHPVENAGITWSSSDEAVATVDAAGLVTAVGNGRASIVAASGPAVASASVSVAQRVAEVRLSSGTGTLTALGDTVRLVAEVFDANGHPVAGAPVVWTSGDGSVVTVDVTGLVTAVGNGSATVTAASGTVMESVAVTVAQVPAEVRLAARKDTLTSLGDTVRVAAGVFDANGHAIVGASLEWSSSDTSVAGVDGAGLVTAVSNGRSVVMAASGFAKGTVALTVAQRPTRMRLPRDPETLTAVDDTVRLVAEPLDANGHPVAGARVAWTSGDRSVARVDGTGLVTAVGNGRTEIGAASGSVKGTVAVTVAQRVADMRLTPERGTLAALEDTLSLAAEAFDRNRHPIAGAVFRWASSDESVATVDGRGRVVAVGNGSTTVSAVSGSVRRSALVTVSQVAAETRLSVPSGPLPALDETVRLVARAFDANGHAIAGASFVWSVRDESVVTVDGRGLVTAVSNGRTTVTAKSGPASATVTVTVEQRVAEIRLSPEPETLDAFGDTVQLVAKAFDANGYRVADASVTWSSGDVAVARVDRAGLVSAVGNGSAEIEAESGTARASTTVTVAQRVAGMRLSPEPETLTALDDTVRLVAEAFDPNGHRIAGAAVRWSSGDRSVVTVDGTGLVVAVGNGRAVVSAVSGSVTASVGVTVKQRAAGMAVSPLGHTLTALDDTVRFKARIVDANGHAMEDLDPAWSSNDELVAVVDADGLVTAVANGTVVIRAVADTLAASVAVTVAQKATRIVVSPESVDLSPNSSEDLDADIFDANGHEIPGAAVTWSSDDTGVATVNRSGRVTAVGGGSTRVRAVSGTVEASAVVRVTPAGDRIRVSPDSAAFTALADTVRLVAEAIDENGDAIEEVDASWSSSDDAVATVDSTGLVTAVDNGIAEITATAGSAEASAVIEVSQEAEELLVSPESATLLEGEDVQLTADVVDANGYPIPGYVFTWSSDDEEVATVDTAGLVEAVAIGNTEVRAVSGEFEASAAVSVDPPGTRIRVSPDTASFTALADTVRLVAEAIDENGDAIEEVEANWSSSDAAVVAVSSTGLVKAVGNGSAEITATAGSATATATIEVSQEADALEVSPASHTLEEGETVQLAADVVDANGYPIPGYDFTWSSDDEAVATVSSTGLVTSKEEGSAEIAAKADGTDFTGVASIVVHAEAVDRIRVSPDAATFTALADTVRLIAESIDENGNAIEEVDASWSSSDRAVATVDSDGLVTAVDNGSAEITATAGSATATATVEVAQEAAAVKVSPDDTTVVQGETLQLTAGVADANGYPMAGFDFTWSSDDRTVATVNSTGLVAAQEEGSVEMTAEAVGTGITGVASIVVEPVTEPRDILALLYDRTGGPNWTSKDNWSTDQPLGSWHGVKVDDQGQVTEVRLGGNGLAGTIPRALANLEHLEWLDLSVNDLTGTIPPELGDLANLEFLSLARNGLTGGIPRELGGLANLEELALNINDLTGAIPPELGNLAGLERLTLGDNSLRGAIPPELGNLGSLAGLDLQANGLTGSIPVQFGNLRSLERLVLNRNELTGTIPVQLGSLTELRSLFMAENSLEGAIPPELGNLSRLGNLSLFENDLTGTIPPQLGNLDNLNHMSLYRNDLSGSIPAELGQLDTLLTLSLSYNGLTGAIPPEIGNLAHLASLRITQNKLTGAIPAELGQLSRLKLLHLDGNDLTGSIPADLGDMAALERLVLRHNELTGSIPSELGDLANLLFLELNNNELSGSVPEELGDLEALYLLKLSNNSGLTGQLPQMLTDLSLRTFHWNATGLCSPDNDDFQNWLDGINDNRGGGKCS